MTTEKELKWTKQRKRVREILEAAEMPLTAGQIFAKLSTEEQEHYALSTIYRILAAFEEHQLVNKSTWMGDQTVTYEWNFGEHKHFAVCLDCHKRIALEHCPIAMLPFRKHAEEFTITDHKLELYGYCKDCNKLHQAEEH